MLAVAARAAPGAETIDVHAHASGAGGGELAEARWFTRDQVRMMLERAAGKRKDGPQAEVVPPPLAIAYHLIERWCERTLF